MKFITFGIISALVILIAVQETHAVVLVGCQNPENFSNDLDRTRFCKRIKKCSFSSKSDVKNEATDEECDSVRPGMSYGVHLNLEEFCQRIQKCFNTADVHNSDFDSIITNGEARIIFWDEAEFE